MKHMKILILLLTLSFSLFNNSAFSGEIINLSQPSDKEKQALIAQIKTECAKIKENMSLKAKLSGLVGVTKENCPTLYNLVYELTKELNLPLPYVNIFKGNIPNDINTYLWGSDFKTNACATSLTQRMSLISIGENLINILSYDELKAIIAHELVHIQKGHTAKGIALYIVLTTIHKAMERIQYLANPSTESEYFNKLLYCVIPAYLLCTKLINAKISRTDETTADLIAVKATKDPLSLINGIEKIEKLALQIYEDSLSYRLFSSHPNMNDRRNDLNKAAEKFNLNKLPAAA